MLDDGKRIFLSYSRDDGDFARSLARAMTGKGAHISFENETASIGDHWAESVRREIEQASAVVLVLPADGDARRNYIWFEVGVAKALGKAVLAVLPPGQKLSRADEPENIADMLVLDADSRPLDSIAEILLRAAPADARSAMALM